jgi:hypothetical protein
MELLKRRFVSVNGLVGKNVPDDVIIRKGVKYLQSLDNEESRHLWLRDQISSVVGKPQKNRVQSLCVDIAQGYSITTLSSEEGRSLYRTCVEYLEDGMS